MKAIIVGGLAAVALVAGAVTGPSFAQTQSDQQSQPNTGGVSKPGVQGLAGSKSGPSMKSIDPITNQRAAAPTATTPPPSDKATMQQDTSKIPGLPGGKSGPAATKKP